MKANEENRKDTQKEPKSKTKPLETTKEKLLREREKPLAGTTLLQ